MKKKKAAKADQDIEALGEELVAEISTLRIMFRDIISRFQSNLEAEMVWCINYLSAPEDEAQNTIKDKHGLEELLKSLRALKLKPQKGKLKDLKKIDAAISLLATRLAE
jgi:hypothetical protein